MPNTNDRFNEICRAATYEALYYAELAFIAAGKIESEAGNDLADQLAETIAVLKETLREI